MKEAVSIAAHILQGGVALIPFDTCYGLICDATNPDACVKLYQLKQRARSKPSAIVLAEPKEINHYAMVSERQQQIINQIMPGKVTVIMQAKEDTTLPRGFVVTKYKTLSFRVPDNGLVIEIAKRTKKPLLSTSANISGKPVILCRSDYVMHPFNANRAERLLTILDETFERPSHSTLVDLTTDTLEIVRPGAVSTQELLSYT